MHRDLNRDVCSTKLEAGPIESAIDLKIEERSLKADASPMEPLKVALRLFTSDEVILREPESDLNSDVCSLKVEEVVREVVNPLISEACLARLDDNVSVPKSVLNSEFFSTRVPPNAIEMLKARKSEFFSARLETRVIESVGLTEQVVAAPACNVHEIEAVVEA